MANKLSNKDLALAEALLEQCQDLQTQLWDRSCELAGCDCADCNQRRGHTP